MPPSFTQPPLPPEFSPDQKIDDFYDHLKNIRQNEGMESITQSDVNVFNYLMDEVIQNLSAYDKTKLTNLFVLLEQLGATESFTSKEVKDACLMQVKLYRDELGL